jgi:hypothetical protein
MAPLPGELAVSVNEFAASKLGQTTSVAVNTTGTQVNLASIASTFMVATSLPRLWVLIATQTCWIRQFAVSKASGIVYATHVTSVGFYLKKNVYWPVMEESEQDGLLALVQVAGTGNAGTLYVCLQSHISDTNVP